MTKISYAAQRVPARLAAFLLRNDSRRSTARGTNAQYIVIASPPSASARNSIRNQPSVNRAASHASHVSTAKIVPTMHDAIFSNAMYIFCISHLHSIRHTARPLRFK